jgi:hypothetical protein
MDMSKTKLYNWTCVRCNQKGILRIIDKEQQKIRVSGLFKKRYYFNHSCGDYIELINGSKT